MSARGHHYRNGVRGRSITTRPGVGGVTIKAHLACSRCPTVGHVVLRQVMPPDQIDRKFTQLGWALDPNLCVTCRRKPAKEPDMSKPSASAMKAQAQMFRLLSDHFDTEKGAFASGWSDQRIATETGLAKDIVAEYRIAGFGEIKEPEALRQLRSDINALEQLARESFNHMTEQVAAMRAQLAKLQQAA